jgi:CBS domain-containing protein
MKVVELMNPRVMKVGPRTPLLKILGLMLRFHLNDVVVVNDKDELLGIVTYGDLARRLLPTEGELIDHEEYMTTPELMEDRFTDIVSLPVEEVMTRNVTTVTPDRNLIEAGAIMHAHHVQQLPVVENRKVVGVISYTDIGWGLIIKYGEPHRRPAGM